MKATKKQTTKATKSGKNAKTRTPKTAKSAASTKTKSKTIKKATAPKIQFLCDCMMGLAVAMMLGSWMWWTSAPSTKVLGVSTRLQTGEILQQINMERAQRGIGPLTINEQLNSAAAAKGENMFDHNYWAHVDPSDGTEPWSFIQDAGYEYQSAGENLGRDFNDEKSLVAAWMASPSHQENILNPQFSDVGLAVLDGQIDGESVVLIVNLFGQPKVAGGQISQKATYDESSDQMVLAGQIGPAEEILSRQKRMLSTWQVALLIVVGVGVTMVLGKLHPKKVRAYRRPVVRRR